jgi:hypothetical protein
MAGEVKSLLLFPLAFTMLVLSKIYLVTKGALVPVLASRDPIESRGGPRDATLTSGPTNPGTLVQPTIPLQSTSPESAGATQAANGPAPAKAPVELSVLNAKLGLLASIAGFFAALPAVLILKLGGASWVLYVDVLVYIAATVAGSQLPIGRAPNSGSVRTSPATGSHATTATPGESAFRQPADNDPAHNDPAHNDPADNDFEP